MNASHPDQTANAALRRAVKTRFCFSEDSANKVDRLVNRVLSVLWFIFIRVYGNSSDNRCLQYAIWGVTRNFSFWKSAVHFGMTVIISYLWKIHWRPSCAKGCFYSECVKAPYSEFVHSHCHGKLWDAIHRTIETSMSISSPLVCSTLQKRLPCHPCRGLNALGRSHESILASSGTAPPLLWKNWAWCPIDTFARERSSCTLLNFALSWTPTFRGMFFGTLA